jgi:MraZ protein
MDLNENTATTCFNSLYEHGVDSKRRLQIPHKWRPSKSGVEFTVVLWMKPNEGTRLRVLPPEELKRLMNDLNGMTKGDNNKLVLRRFIGTHSEQVTLDKSGRICLPEKMAREAGITDKAVLVGLLNTFEVWSPERFNRVQAADAVMAPEAFKLMD